MRMINLVSFLEWITGIVIVCLIQFLVNEFLLRYISKDYFWIIWAVTYVLIVVPLWFGWLHGITYNDHKERVARYESRERS